jgi:hypothetical protein
MLLLIFIFSVLRKLLLDIPYYRTGYIEAEGFISLQLKLAIAVYSNKCIVYYEQNFYSLECLEYKGVTISFHIIFIFYFNEAIVLRFYCNCIPACCKLH